MAIPANTGASSTMTVAQRYGAVQTQGAAQMNERRKALQNEAQGTQEQNSPKPQSQTTSKPPGLGQNIDTFA